MHTIGFCEIDPFCRRVLAKHWPHIPIWDDVRTLTGRDLATARLVPDVICGGWPCQDLSVAGKGAGLAGERSGLWSHFARIVGDVRPKYAVMENVAALLGRGIERVLGDLAALGYDAEWHCIPASAVGAPHRRDRVWIVAYPNDRRQLQPQGRECDQRRWFGNGGADVADADQPRLEARLRSAISQTQDGTTQRPDSVHRWWLSEPDVGRVAHGVPARVDRLRALGNAVVPQIPEIIGRAILNGPRAPGPPAELRS